MPIFSRFHTPLTQSDYCTVGNRTRLKLNLSPTLHTAKFDRLRDAKIKEHNELFPNKHNIQLQLPEHLPVDEITERTFNSWWGGAIKVVCQRCDSRKSLAYLKNFMRETCCDAVNQQLNPNEETSHSITNQYRIMVGLKTCNMQTYFDKKRRNVINLNNDKTYTHQITITPPPIT